MNAMQYGKWYGKWSVYLNTFFLSVAVLSCFLVFGLKVLSFDDHWWDVTVPIIVLASIVGLIFGIISVRKGEKRSWLVIVSIIVSCLMILFVITHSLFIND